MLHFFYITINKSDKKILIKKINNNNIHVIVEIELLTKHFEMYVINISIFPMFSFFLSEKVNCAHIQSTFLCWMFLYFVQYHQKKCVLVIRHTLPYAWFPLVINYWLNTIFIFLNILKCFYSLLDKTNRLS